MTAIGKAYRVVLATDKRGPIGRPKPAATRKRALPGASCQEEIGT
jgi:hypothetical protein